ncbi:polysaccharide deacetylase family protein [uncultured Tenacibaculum sp.]|uniref:polysaccharide deacetylase family protein n=1 Tax=uncultured Tenacibaculum sp. TaxID=174713 RepID=UPI002606AD72|nr:polysaccharide deacetylase family protein [uncultured Tenacibaculum sp.]
MMKESLKKVLLILGGFLFNNRKSKVLYYHDVHGDKKYTSMSTDIDLFKNHISQIKKNGYSIVKEISNNRNEVLICFDDGFRGVYENRDFFIKNKIYATIFLITSCINEKDFLTEKEIIELKNIGLFKFESHTHTHRNLGELTEKEIEEEVVLSKSILEKLLGEKVESLCFPRGVFSEKSIEIAKEKGYKRLYLSIPGEYFNKNDNKIKLRYFAQETSKKMFPHLLRGGQNIFSKKLYKMHKR